MRLIAIEESDVEIRKGKMLIGTVSLPIGGLIVYDEIERISRTENFLGIINGRSYKLIVISGKLEIAKFDEP